MISARRVLFGFVCLLMVLGVAGVRDQLVTAQSATASVNLRRITALNFEVFTADFNGDGIVDLVSHQASAGSFPVIALGRGDGTFAAATTITACACRVIGIGDLDKDGKIDVIAEQPPNPSVPNNTIVVLRGNGNGTFTLANANVTTPSSAAFSLVFDYDGDGHNDLVLGEDNDGDASLHFLRGNGDFTFTFDRFVAANGPLTSGITADVNGDGRPDIVTTSHDGRVVSVYLNGSAGGFSASDIPFADQTNDVAAADVDHDGKIDLLVATSEDGSDDLFYTSGSVQVLRGNGNGTFQAPRVYPSGRGAWKLVVGDFNRDGIPDVATANRSGKLAEDYCGHVWDSVSILPGRTDGSFTAPSTFSLGDQTLPQGDRFYNSVLSLSKADLNGDGFPDLVTSWGGILLNHAPDTNWAPTVDAGPDRDASTSHAIALLASASDVDQDQLTYRWTDSGGTPIENSPAPCIVAPATLGVHTFTVTVDDGQGHTASDSVVVDFGSSGGTNPPPSLSITAPTASSVLTAGQPFLIQWNATAGSAPINRFDIAYSTDDGVSGHSIIECEAIAGSGRSCQWNNPPATEQARIWITANAQDGQDATVESARFAIRTSSTGTLGNGWSHSDVGQVGAAGNATYDGLIRNGDGLTLTGSGADIWGTADEFHFAWKHMTGDFSIDTYVDSLQNTNAWAKAGLMIRTTALDAASAHASIVVSPSRGIAFQRRTAQFGTSTSTQGPSLTAPLWLRLTRQASTIKGWYRKNATDAWTQLDSQVINNLSGPVDVGLATTSHADGTLATAKFTGVYLAPIESLIPTAFGAATGGWAGVGTQFNFTGSGSDIWGTSDSFVFNSVPIGNYQQMTVRVRSIGNTNAWAKAGVMIRESLDAGSQHADAIVSPSKGIAMQYRGETGGASASPVEVAGAAPIWLRIRRFESATPGAAAGFSTWYSTDFVTWRRLGDVNITIAHDAFIGIAVTSHKAGTETTAVIDDIRLER
jgi:FG-GAP-like repeat